MKNLKKSHQYTFENKQNVNKNFWKFFKNYQKLSETFFVVFKIILQNKIYIQ